jgi:hypothetical protein
MCRQKAGKLMTKKSAHVEYGRAVALDQVWAAATIFAARSAQLGILPLPCKQSTTPAVASNGAAAVLWLERL